MTRILLSVLIIFTIFSCKKDENSPDPVQEIFKLKEIRTITDKLVTNYEYNAENKVSKIEYYDTISGLSEAYRTFEYTANSVIRTGYSLNNAGVSKIEYWLDDSGRAKIKIDYFENNRDTLRLEYDDHGYLIRSIGKNYIAHEIFDTAYYNYEDGKRTSISCEGDSILIEYYDFKIPLRIKGLLDNLYGSLGDFIDKEIFFGNNSDYAIKSITYQHSPTAQYIVVDEFSYEFDDSNNLSKIHRIIRYKDSYILNEYEMKIKIGL